MTYEVSPARPDELDELFSLEKRCFNDAWSLRSLSDELCHPDGLFLTASSCAGIFGFISVRKIPPSCELMQVAADPDCRRLGIGETLILTAVSLLSREGINEMNLEVGESNAPALALYKKLGFREVGRRPNYYPETAILMTKNW